MPAGRTARRTDGAGSGGGRAHCTGRLARPVLGASRPASGLLDGPEGAVAAFLKAGDDLAEMGAVPTLADDGGAHDENEMQMFGHDDIRIDRHHLIMSGDGGEQLVLYGGADSGECYGCTVGMVAGERTQGTPQAFCHLYRDVVDAWARVVVSG